MSTYYIYSNHMSNSSEDPNREAAEALANLMRRELKSRGSNVEVIVRHGVEGVGSGYHGDSDDERETCEYLDEHLQERAWQLAAKATKN